MSVRVESPSTFISPASRRDLPKSLLRDVGCSVVIDLISKANNVPARLLIHPSRGRRQAAGARQLAMYLMHVALGRRLADIGDMFGRDRTTVSHACSLVEDRRDDAKFDQFVCGLELSIETALAATTVEAGDGAR